MRLLLDTHALIWFCEGSERLSQTARAAMEDEGNECWISHATAWEIAIKLSLRKLELEIPYADLFPDLVTENGWRILRSNFVHYGALLNLPRHHRDPFDRLLIVQAQMEGFTIVSSDPHFSSYRIPVLW